MCFTHSASEDVLSVHSKQFHISNKILYEFAAYSCLFAYRYQQIENMIHKRRLILIRFLAL